MGIFYELQREMLHVEEESSHLGYWYSISEVLTVLVLGMLCGLEKIVEICDWSKSEPTKQFLESEFGITKTPCVAHFYNILSYVDADKFNLSFSRWMKKVLGMTLNEKTVAIDGKTICGTDKLTSDGSVLHIASALVSELNLVLGSYECGTKTGEITAFRELISLLDVGGAIVVADALHCNQKSAQAVTDAGADYLFVVKDNVPNLKSNIELYVQNEDMLQESTTEKNGGRVEKRTAYICSDIEWLDGKENWKNIACIGAIHREFEKGEAKSSEWHYYISSRILTPEALLKHARLEWGVEAMHWLLDVHFGEDKTRVWDMNVQKMLNTSRKIALNLVRLYKVKNCSKNASLSGIMRKNLFDLNKLLEFVNFFCLDFKLE